VDPNSKTGFAGLPDGWEDQLTRAKFTKEEITDDGAVILDVLRFHMEQVRAVHSIALSLATAS
jgi:hypothetical protein